MLSETKRSRNVALSRTRAAGLLALLVFVGLAVSGIRGPMGTSPLAQAAPPDNQKAPPAAAHEPISLEFVPLGSVAVIGLRPAALLGRPGMQRLTDFFNDFPRQALQEAFQFEKVEEAIFALGMLPPERRPEDVVVTVLRYEGPFDWKSFVKSSVGEIEPAGVNVGGKTYYRATQPALRRPGAEDSPHRAYCLPDDRTVVMGPEDLLQQVLATGGAEKSDWADDWRRFSSGQLAVTVDVATVNQALAPLRQGPPPPELAAILALAPLWEKSQRLFISGAVDTGISLVARADCASADDARLVEQTANAALTLGRNALGELGNKLAAAPTNTSEELLPLIDLGSGLLKSGKLTSDGEHVNFTTRLDVDVADTAIAVLMPALEAAREAARRQQAMNNLKQLMLGLHNYADVHGHFPPPLVMGPDGKTPHSWRVAILPYIEQQALYQQYKFDEPWDSDNNKRVLDQMPATLRDPKADPNSKETAYFALVGPQTCFGEKNGTGTTFADIKDGTSNTILIVEAKRAVPWTKPEDIAYDAAKPLPNFGGLHPNIFLVAFADGSVRAISEEIDEQVLRHLITRAGGEAVGLFK